MRSCAEWHRDRRQLRCWRRDDHCENSTLLWASGTDDDIVASGTDEQICDRSWRVHCEPEGIQPSTRASNPLACQRLELHIALLTVPIPITKTTVKRRRQLHHAMRS